MRSIRWMRWTALSLVAVVATLASLSARGLDDDKRLLGFLTCDELNQGTNQWAEANCLEGDECVVCTEQEIGELANQSGEGPKKWKGVNTDCGGIRLIGICVGNGGPCDLSMHYVDGTCTGAVTNYENQPTPVDP
jgi:hypothetical protein